MAKNGEPDDDLELEPQDGAEEQDDEQEQPDDTEQESDEPVEDERIDAQPEGDRQPDQQDRTPSRRDRRIESLTNEVRESKQRNDDLNKRLDALIAGQATRPPPGETPEVRASRLALLTPEERITETLHESERKHATEMHGLQFAILDGNDRVAFEAKATVDPLYTKWKPRVEAELADLRSKGQNVDREKLMDYLIGKHARESRQKVAGQQRADARGRVDRQRTRPGNSGSDTAGTRRDRGTSLERRLENQSI